MAVILSPGRSGNRFDSRVPDAQHLAQPIPITTTNAPDDTQYPKCNSTTPPGDRGNCVVPTGGNNPVEGGAT